METDRDGSRHGLVVDYLNEIAKYTGWKYEYIDTDSDNLVKEFMEGNYDLMSGSYYTPEMEAYCAYPDYDIGCSKAVLLAREDDDSIRGTDARTLNGKTIGVYDRAAESVRRLKEFLDINDIQCTLKYYSYEQSGAEGNLYPYLENGEVDLLLGNNGEMKTPFRVVFAYDLQPYYIVTNVGNQAILDSLNTALEKIVDSLRVKSEIGRGSEFFFTIPMAFGNPAEEHRTPQEDGEKKNLLQGVHILLAEDNDLNAEIAAELLKMRGASVKRSENGRAAAECFAGSGGGNERIYQQANGCGAVLQPFGQLVKRWIRVKMQPRYITGTGGLI